MIFLLIILKGLSDDNLENNGFNLSEIFENSSNAGLNIQKLTYNTHTQGGQKWSWHEIRLQVTKNAQEYSWNFNIQYFNRFHIQASFISKASQFNVNKQELLVTGNIICFEANMTEGEQLFQPIHYCVNIQLWVLVRNNDGFYKLLKRGKFLLVNQAKLLQHEETELQYIK